MEIISVKIGDIRAHAPVIENKLRSDKAWVIGYSYSIKRHSEDEFVQTITIEINLNKKAESKSIYLKVENLFLMKLAGSEITPSKEADYEKYADLAQSAAGQTRAIFHMASKGTPFEHIFLPLNTFNEQLASVKKAVFTALN